MMRRTLSKSLTLGLLAVIAAYVLVTRLNLNLSHTPGEKLDEFNGVPVYYNGAINHTGGRNLAPDGYNLGLKYQCVEFVKRYYYQRFNHKMPNSMGHAKSFFLESVPNGAENPERALRQYRNGAGERPMAEDLIVFSPWILNRYGHVAIVSAVGPDFIEVIQQNPGPFGSSRERYPLAFRDGRWRVGHDRALGWLRRGPEHARRTERGWGANRPRASAAGDKALKKPG